MRVSPGARQAVASVVRIVATATLGAAVVTAPGAAAGADKESCVSAHEQAQRRRTSHELLAARSSLVYCLQDGCPSLVRADCGAWLQQVDAAIPSVVLAAKDAAGHDLAGVRVLVDGQRWLESLDGTAVALDPGTHVFRFEHLGNMAAERSVILREGEKDRLVVESLSEATPPIEMSHIPVEPTARSPRASSPLPPALAGGAAAAFAAFLYLGIQGKIDADRLGRTCAPSCTDAAVGPVQSELRAADVFLGASIVLAGAAAWLMLGRPPAGDASRVSLSTRGWTF